MKKNAFTLIELMIVVAIIGILAAIAIPNFVKFQCRSKQSEAKGNLKALYVSEESYRAENDTYIALASISEGNKGDTNSIGFQPKGAKIRYVYTASGATSTFGASATVLAKYSGELNGDIWTTTHANDVLNPTNGCQ